ncbi:MAG TPA: aspartate aminotransferase family protein [Hanamia sp.]|nr:aspartate aminotransferase family protein [Hanamia sp.]
MGNKKMTNRQIFLNHIGQTSPNPLTLEIVRASNSKLYDINDREYIDLIGGISVCNIGHGNKKVIDAIKKQADNFMHVMVNGELVLSPQTAYAKLLTDQLPSSLNSVFFTTSGTEATEGAMKLAKRFTNRTQIAAFKNSYHGSTQGSLSIIGDEYWRNAFRPLLPDILHLDYNNFKSLESITTQTACVIAETIQAEAGVIVPDKKWMQALREKCTDTKTLLVLDEIQCGFGRNGTLWAFEQFDIIPDILLLGKALGGGMPLGAFIAEKKIMDSFTNNPVLGHINTFGGHPVCCAAGNAAMEFLLEENIIKDVFEKEKLFLKYLHHSKIENIKSRGLMFALEFDNFYQNKKVIDALIEKGVFTDWFLFASQCLRIVPPLTISKDDIQKACKIICQVVSDL